MEFGFTNQDEFEDFLRLVRGLVSWAEAGMILGELNLDGLSPGENAELERMSIGDAILEAINEYAATRPRRVYSSEEIQRSKAAARLEQPHFGRSGGSSRVDSR